VAEATKQAAAAKPAAAGAAPEAAAKAKGAEGGKAAAPPAGGKGPAKGGAADGKGPVKGGAGGGASADLLGLCTIQSSAVDTADEAVMRGDVQAMLSEVFRAVMYECFPSAREKGLSPDLVPNPAPGKFIHQYQCNAALGLAGKLKGMPDAPANPRVAAEKLLEAVLKRNSPLIGRAELSGPGYINVYLPVNFIAARVAYLLGKGVQPSIPARVYKVAVDYSSPNIAKEMHIGHLRSTIIGDAIARMLEFCGHNVLRINHVGDWGTQFGMLLAHLKDLQAEGKPVKGSIADLSGFYKQAKGRFDKEPEFKARAHKEVVALQAGDATNLALWREMVDVSAQMFSEVYSRLGIDSRLELCGESFYNPLIASTLQELESRGLCEISDGALVMKIDGYEVPLMVRKSDGGFGYDTTDITAIRYRLKDLGCDWLAYVIDSGQSLHLELVFQGAKKAGWWDPSTGVRVDHVGFGVVQGEDKKKFKSRSGDTVRLVDVLDEAKSRALVPLMDRAATAAANAASAAGAAAPAALTEAEKAELEKSAAVLGYGGVKYFDLKQNRLSDYVFNYERMLSPDGDTAVYLEYAHARLCSILRKAREQGVNVDALSTVDPASEGFKNPLSLLTFTHSTELFLCLELLRFQEVMNNAANGLYPHFLCDYLYTLSLRTAEFHRDCHVLSADNAPAVRDTRIRIVAATASVIKTIMKILGLIPLERI
jgi:arginyl-tRNA synthetase